jgi:hypothetical protein
MPAAQKDTKAKRTPFKPKEPLPAAERLPKLYRALTDQVEGSHFAGAIKTCQKSVFLSHQRKSHELMYSPLTGPTIISSISNSAFPPPAYR